VRAAVDAVVGFVGVVGCHPPRLRPPLSLLFPEVRPGRPSPTRAQGVSPCGPTRVREGGLIPRTSRRPWSRVLPPTRRPGLHPLRSARRGRAGEGGVGWDQAAPAQSFSTVGLTPPVGTKWIADSGASYHTTPDAGILSSVRPPHPSCPSSIMVGDGSCLPVTSVDSSLGPFRLSDVLVVPQMVHNLLSIRQFTADNSCSVEFDSSGLSVKDSTTGRPLLRCDITGPLYTLRLPSSAASTSPSSSSSAALAVTPSSTTWHR
jgi:hypothetical protein